MKHTNLLYLFSANVSTEFDKKILLKFPIITKTTLLFVKPFKYYNPFAMLTISPTPSKTIDGR